MCVRKFTNAYAGICVNENVLGRVKTLSLSLSLSLREKCIRKKLKAYNELPIVSRFQQSRITRKRRRFWLRKQRICMHKNGRASANGVSLNFVVSSRGVLQPNISQRRLKMRIKRSIYPQWRTFITAFPLDVYQLYYHISPSEDSHHPSEMKNETSQSQFKYTAFILPDIYQIRPA